VAGTSPAMTPWVFPRDRNQLYPASGGTGAPSFRSFSTIRSHDIQNPKVRASVESPNVLGLVGASTVMVSQKLPLPRIGRRTSVSA